MKKLFSLLAVLLCLSVLAVPVFADLIVPPDAFETEATTAPATTETVTEAAETAAELVKTAAEPAASASSGPNRTVLYLVIGVAVLAAAFVLYKLLRKPAK